MIQVFRGDVVQVYALAKECKEELSLEDFGVIVGQHFVRTYPKVQLAAFVGFLVAMVLINGFGVLELPRFEVESLTSWWSNFTTLPCVPGALNVGFCLSL